MKPILIVCSGPPCSGKSTIAAALAERYQCLWLNIDRVLLEILPQSKRSEADRLVGYRAMLLLARELLHFGHSVVLDATFTSTESRRLLHSTAAQASVEAKEIQMYIRPEAAVRRFLARTDHSAIDLTDQRVRELAESYPYSSSVLVLNGESPLDENVLRLTQDLRC